MVFFYIQQRLKDVAKLKNSKHPPKKIGSGWVGSGPF